MILAVSGASQNKGSLDAKPARDGPRRQDDLAAQSVFPALRYDRPTCAFTRFRSRCSDTLQNLLEPSPADEGAMVPDPTSLSNAMRAQATMRSSRRNTM